MKISIFKNNTRQFQQWYANFLKYAMLNSPEIKSLEDISKYERELFEIYDALIDEYPIINFTNEELATLFFLKFS